MKLKLNRLGEALKRQDWLALFIDLIVLVLGITIAFQLNNWKEARDREELLSFYKANLLEETIGNLEEMEGLQEYRIQTTTRLDTLNQLLKEKGKEWDDPIRDQARYLLRTSIPDLSNIHLTTFLGNFTGPEQLQINAELLRLQAIQQELQDMYDHFYPQKQKLFYDPLFGNMDDDLRVIEVEKVKNITFRNGLIFLLMEEHEINRLHGETIEQLHRVCNLLKSGTVEEKLVGGIQAP